MLSKRYEYDDTPVIYLNSVQMNALYHYKRDVEDGKYTFEKYDCECGCAFDELKLIASKDRYGNAVETRICPQCGLIMTNPRMNQKSYNEFYDSYYRKLYLGKERPSNEYFEVQRARGRDIFDYISANVDINNINTVLEIGCSAGGILSIFSEHGILAKGIDLGSEYVSFGREMGLDLESISSRELLAKNPSEKYDLIILNHVFEHFLDLEYEFAAIQELLKDDGFIYIAVPGVMNMQQYKNDFLRYLQNAHVRHFCKATLKMVMEKYGFKDVCIDEDVKAIFIKKRENYHKAVTDKSCAVEELLYLSSLEDRKEGTKIEKNTDRHNAELLVQWIKRIERGSRIESSLDKLGYQKIAIFGTGLVGRVLYDALIETNIQVQYFIDINKKMSVSGTNTYLPNENKPAVDVIIIATAIDYWQIYKDYLHNEKVMTIQDIIEMVS